MKSSTLVERRDDKRTHLPKCYKCGRHLYDGKTCRGCGTRLSVLDRSRFYRGMRRATARLNLLLGTVDTTRLMVFVMVVLTLCVVIYFVLQTTNTPIRTPGKKSADMLYDYATYALLRIYPR